MRVALRPLASRNLIQAPVYLFLSAVLAVGCGGSKPPPKKPKSEARADRGEREESTMGIESDVGGLNEAKVKRAFKNCLKGFTECLNEGWERVEFMGGYVSFYVAVAGDGSLESTYLETSTLGDRATERCLLDVIREQQWPKPVGGKIGEARNSLSFDPPDDVRPPLEWSIDDISKALSGAAEQIDRCKRNANPGRYALTMYVDTDGSPMAAGGTPPGPGADMALDCLIGVLMQTQFPSPGSYPAKVTFDL